MSEFGFQKLDVARRDRDDVQIQLPLLDSPIYGLGIVTITAEHAGEEMAQSHRSAGKFTVVITHPNAGAAVLLDSDTLEEAIARRAHIVENWGPQIEEYRNADIAAGGTLQPPTPEMVEVQPWIGELARYINEQQMKDMGMPPELLALLQSLSAGIGPDEDEDEDFGDDDLPRN